MRDVRIILAAAVLAGVLGGAEVSAQPVFGTFPWQMQPYCNVVTLTVYTRPGGFTLDGSDDLCGATQQAGASGTGVLNADGSVGLNFTIVAPGGIAVHVSAVVSPATGQGTWNDSAGSSGTFAFFGNMPALPARPLPPNVARRGQLMTGQLTVAYPPNASFVTAGGSFPVPLPATTPRPTLERVIGAATTSTCPGIGRSTPGRLCVYDYDSDNIGSVLYGGTSTGLNRLHGFSLDVFPVSPAVHGYFVASWAYVVP